MRLQGASLSKAIPITASSVPITTKKRIALHPRNPAPMRNAGACVKMLLGIKHAPNSMYSPIIVMLKGLCARGNRALEELTPEALRYFFLFLSARRAISSAKCAKSERCSSSI